MPTSQVIQEKPTATEALELSLLYVIKLKMHLANAASCAAVTQIALIN